MTTDVLAQAAAIIRPHLTGTFRLDDRAAGRAQELADAGLLAGGTPRIALPPREAVANTLQATMSWAPAEQVAAELDAAGLLAGGSTHLARPTRRSADVKPAELKIGDRLDTAIGRLVVSTEPREEFDADTPHFDRVFVDVEVPEPGRFGDAARMLEVTGASDFSWLGLLPLRYRLAFLPDTDVEVTR